MITLTQDSMAVGCARPVSDAVIEEYCSLVHRIYSGCDASNGKSITIGVTGCTVGAGTSTVALNLASAAARLGDRPVLLADLSARAEVALRFPASGDLRLRAALPREARAGRLVTLSDIPNLFVLDAMDEEEACALTLDRRGTSELLRSLELDFGLIVADLPNTDSSLCFALAGLFDGILLTMEAERTRRNTATRAQQRLLQAQANILGVILNKHRQYIPNWLDARL